MASQIKVELGLQRALKSRSCKTFGNLHNLSRLQLSHVYRRIMSVPNSQGYEN